MDRSPCSTRTDLAARCLAVLLIGTTYTAGATELPPVRYSFHFSGITASNGTVVLTCIDRQNFENIQPVGRVQATATTNSTGVEPIVGWIAANDLTVSVSMSPPTNTAFTPLWTFAVTSSWKEVSKDFPGTWVTNNGTASLSGQLYYTGSLGISYRALANTRFVTTTNEENGVTVCRTAPVLNEEWFPMKLEEPTSTAKGLRVYRIAYAKSDGKVQSLAVVVADSLDLLSRNVRVANTNPRFAWNTNWFQTVGPPIFTRTGAPPTTK